MGSSKINATLALFLLFNILFFTFTSACDTCKPKPKPKPKPKACPPPPKPTPPTPTPPKPTPTPPTPTPPNPSEGKCPIDTLKLGACADLLGGLLHIVVGTPSSQKCCSLIQGLADIDAAVCLCTAIKANLLGINLNVPISLSLLLNACGDKVPEGFKCA